MTEESQSEIEELELNKETLQDLSEEQSERAKGGAEHVGEGGAVGDGRLRLVCTAPRAAPHGPVPRSGGPFPDRRPDQFPAVVARALGSAGRSSSE